MHYLFKTAAAVVMLAHSDRVAYLTKFSMSDKIYHYIIFHYSVCFFILNILSSRGELKSFLKISFFFQKFYDPCII